MRYRARAWPDKLRTEVVLGSVRYERIVSPTPAHLKALEELEREAIPGLVEVLREEGLDAAR